MARLIGPNPARASARVSSMPSQTFTWSATVRWSWRKVRWSSPIGAVAKPSIRMTRQSSRITGVAPGAPIAAAYPGAPAKQPRYSAPLATTEIVVTVGVISRGSPGQRTMARLTPRSLTLVMMVRATDATA